MAEAPKIVLDADIAGLRRKLRDAADEFNAFGKKAEGALGAISGPIAGLQSKFLALAAVLAGGAIFKEAVTATAQFTEQSIQLGRAMGTNATAASTWMFALEDVGASAEELGSASKFMQRQLRDNEDQLNRLGLVTRNADGSFRDMTSLLQDSISITNQYRDGVDRNIVAMTLFGERVDGSSKLLNINTDTLKENEEWARKVGAAVGENSVTAFRLFDAASDKLGITMTGLKNTIGNALMPVLAKLTDWLNTIAPAAIVVIKGALGGLLSAFWLLKNGVTVVWETINAMVVTVAEPIRALAESMAQLVEGDFRGAWQTIKAVPTEIGKAWKAGFDEVLESSQETRDRIYALFAEDAPVGAPAGGGKNAPAGLGDKGGDKKGKTERDSLIAYYEERLAQAKVVAAQEDALRGMSKEAERQFWLDALNDQRLTAQERAQIQKRVAGLEVDILKENAQAKKQIDDAYERARVGVAAEFRRAKLAADLAAVDEAEALMQAEYEADKITKVQRLEAEMEFIRQRAAIRRAALDEEIALEADVVRQANMRTEQEAIDHQLRLDEIRKGVQLGEAEKSAWADDLAQGFGTALDGMLLRAQTFQEAMGGLWGSMKATFLKYMVTEPLMQWIASKARMLAVSLGFMSAETAAKATGATTGAAVTAAGATAEVGSKAASAAAGGASAMSSIPYVGPILAVAAFAAILAMVLGAKKSIKSAAGGYDIPAGSNPLTQLHEQEMVLPAKFANVIRGMAGREQAPAPAGDTINLGGLSITAMDGADVRRVLLDNPSALREALQKALRDIGRS